MRFTEDQMTPWFPGTVKPERPGVYKVQVFEASPSWMWSHFNGRRWGGVAYVLNEAATKKITQFEWLNDPGELIQWRGLNFNPEAQ